MYYAAHGFFLSKHSIFLVLFNLLESREDSEIRLKFWLESIQAHVKSARVIIVGTHLDNFVSNREEVTFRLEEIKDRYAAMFPDFSSIEVR